MSNRTTIARLVSLAVELNQLLNRPIDVCTRNNDGTYTWNVNCIYVENYTPRYYQLQVITNKDGGTSQLGNSGTVTEIEHRLCGMIAMHYGLKNWTK